MERKAAFQLSLGFIIAVVFSIVLLSLALTWLRGTIEGIIGLTDDLTQEAQSQLRESFRATATSFAIWPSQYSLAPSKGLRMSAGIENDAPDGKDHLFVINVLPAAADDNVLAAKGCVTFEACATLQQEMSQWATFDSTAGKIQINSFGFKFIEVRPVAEAVKGTYIYNVVSCYDKVLGSTPVSSGCIPISDNLWGGSAQQLIISIV